MFAIAALLAAAPVVAGYLDNLHGMARSESLHACQSVARDHKGSVDDCRVYVKRGIDQLESLGLGSVDQSAWSTCYAHNRLYDGRGYDYAAVAECVKYAQDHDGSTEGAFTFRHKRYH
ncbi:hypothetical protein [Salinisphaera orenii]|uniref:hypothetical protein n=1 Tax=Salinisphaera orenii TaxID=856731 RepID=UPI0013A68174